MSFAGSTIAPISWFPYAAFTANSASGQTLTPTKSESFDEEPFCKVEKVIVPAFKSDMAHYLTLCSAPEVSQVSSRASCSKDAQEVSSCMLGHLYKVEMGQLTLSRFIGKGSASIVFEATFIEESSSQVRNVAAKINPIFATLQDNLQSRAYLHKEALVLKALCENDARDEKCISRFVSMGQINLRQYCIVQNLYALDLRQALKENPSKGFAFKYLYTFACDLLTALDYLRNPCNDMVHADIKPENIFLEDCGHLRFRLADFSHHMVGIDEQTIKTTLTTIYYRPPEVILSLELTHNFDMWSFGCCLFEVMTGSILFPATNDDELLAMMSQLLGPLDEELVMRMDAKGIAFEKDETNQMLYHHKFEASKVKNFMPRDQFFDESLKEVLIAQNKFLSGPGEVERLHFYMKDFLFSLLKWNPKQRLTPLEALGHPFLQIVKELFFSK